MAKVIRSGPASRLGTLGSAAEASWSKPNQRPAGGDDARGGTCISRASNVRFRAVPVDRFGSTAAANDSFRNLAEAATDRSADMPDPTVRLAAPNVSGCESALSATAKHTNAIGSRDAGGEPLRRGESQRVGSQSLNPDYE